MIDFSGVGGVPLPEISGVKAAPEDVADGVVFFDGERLRMGTRGRVYAG